MTKHVVLCLILILSLGAITACGQQNIPKSSAQQTSNNTQSTAVPGAKTTNNGFLSAPIVAPPSYGHRPLKPGETPQAETLPNGLPALKPLKGVNVDSLFAENLSNSDQRFDRLENAVVDMRREFEAVKPAIVRLVAVEEDIQQMVEQLELLASQEQQARSAPIKREPLNQPQSLVPTDLTTPQTSGGVPQAMEPKTAPAKPMAPKEPMKQEMSYGGPIVKNLRTGRHSDKIRLVLDMSSKTPYSVDLDASENLLVIELPEAGWSGTRSKNFGMKAALLSSYSVESINAGKGTRIIIALKKSTAILKKDLIPPGVTPHYRMYIDLKL